MSRILLRQGLLRKLQSALNSGHAVVEAPAGYGKTLLLQQLVRQRPHTHLVQLTVSDRDPGVLQQRLEPWLADEQLANKRALLLDDVHHLQDAAASCAWLQEQCRQAYPRLVICGRAIPLQPALLTHARRFRQADLAFVQAESGALLENLPPAIAAGWHRQLEGWPLGVGLLTQLAGPNLRSQEDVSEVARPQLFAYLAQNVYDDLPAHLQAFLRATAVPLRFNDELAAVLTQRDDASTLRRELQRRNLFLYDDEAPGWYRYHDLIRDFLLSAHLALDPASGSREPAFRRAIDWFIARGDLEMAIEHAFAAGILDVAAGTMIDALDAVLMRQGRVWTYQRWIEQLDAQTLRAHLALLPPFIRKLHEAGLRQEAWHYLHQLLRLATEAGDRGQLAEAYWLQGFLYFNEARHEESLQALEGLAEHGDSKSKDVERRHYELLGHNLAGLNRLHEARRAYARAILLAEELDNEAAAMYTRHNMVNLVLLRQGKLAESRRALLASDRFFQSSGPYLLAGHLLSWAEWYQEAGDWEGLAAVLKEQEAALDHLEEWIDDDRLYVLWSRAFLYTGQGRFKAAQETLDEALALRVEDDLAQLCLASVQAWLYRRQGQATAVVEFVEQTLRQYEKWPYWRAVLALEREIALTLGARQVGDKVGTRDGGSSRPASPLLHVRAAPHLVRLRALLAVRCWNEGHDRWRRHFHAALHGLQRPHFDRLLTSRDPELGVQFWRIALVEGLCLEQAEGALTSIGQAQPLLDLLGHESGAVRRRVARVVAAIGDERAMPAIEEAARAEKHKPTGQILNKSLARLEELPPPGLEIGLMGSFRMARGGEPVPAAAFHRPVVLRLLQYFAVHRGRIMPRDRVLEDLWPGTPYEKAWATFRSVHSRLRKVLEPYMRSNGPVRYFSVEGESYQFDPLGVVTVDSEQFERGVRRALQDVAAPISPLPDELLAALEGWQPLLPDLAYADWLTETRQRLHDVYVEGCLYVAQAFLQRDEPAAAVTWAQRTVAEAPWFESGYQALMQAYARQGQRTLALKVYSDAVQALAEEFAVAPSPLTEWLRSRLEAGETI